MGFCNFLPAYDTEENQNLIKEILNQSTKELVLVAGLGGRTSCDAIIWIANIAKSLNINIIAFVSSPFKWEGKRQEKALKQINQIKQFVENMIVINCEEIYEEYGNIQFEEVFNYLDEYMVCKIRSFFNENILDRNET